MTVSNTGDRPIQVGSHCHFFEANRALTFEREQAFGFRLCIPVETAVRFEPAVLIPTPPERRWTVSGDIRCKPGCAVPERTLARGRGDVVNLS